MSTVSNSLSLFLQKPQTFVCMTEGSVQSASMIIYPWRINIEGKSFPVQKQNGACNVGIDKNYCQVLLLQV